MVSNGMNGTMVFQDSIAQYLMKRAENDPPVAVKLVNPTKSIAHFVFKKKDGSYREAWGTTQTNIAKAKTNGRGVSREAYKTTAYFDVEVGKWRSFRWENLVQVF